MRCFGKLLPNAVSDLKMRRCVKKEIGYCQIRRSCGLKSGQSLFPYISIATMNESHPRLKMRWTAKLIQAISHKALS